MCTNLDLGTMHSSSGLDLISSIGTVVLISFLVLERGLLFFVASNPRVVPGLLSLHRKLVNY